VHDVTKPVISAVPDDFTVEATSATGEIIGPDRGLRRVGIRQRRWQPTLGHSSTLCASSPRVLCFCWMTRSWWCALPWTRPATEATEAFEVSVVDTTEPVIDVPESIGVEAEGPGGKGS
jgi:hypothetical protein